MSDSSEDEDLSRFRDAIDTSFSRMIDESRGADKPQKETIALKSERYLEYSSHYNDVKVSDGLQKQIGAKISALIERNVKYVDVEQNVKKIKIKGGVKLFKDSEGFLTCEEAKDTYTEQHNIESRKLKKMRKSEKDDLTEEEKCCAVAVSGEHVLSAEETKCWKSRRKEKIFKYKSQGKISKVLISVE